VTTTRHHAGGVGDNYALDSLYRSVAVKAGVADPVAEHQSPGSQTLVSSTTAVYGAAQGRISVSVTSCGTTTTKSYVSDALQFYASVGGVANLRDANGNLRDDGTLLYEYDFRNQLCRVKVKATGALVAAYDYDALGRRIGKSTSAGASRYAWSRGTTAAVYDGQGLVARLHYGAEPDKMLCAYQRDIADLDGDSSVTDHVFVTPLYDGAYDCVGVLGPTGAVAERYVHTYDGHVGVTNAVGQPIQATAIGWLQGYARMWRDDETGLLYARHRYYSPALGRFTMTDPLGAWHDQTALGNGLQWIGNSFRNAWDPSGLKKACCGKKYAQTVFDYLAHDPSITPQAFNMDPADIPAASERAKNDLAAARAAILGTLRDAMEAGKISDVRFASADKNGKDATLKCAADPCCVVYSFIGHGNKKKGLFFNGDKPGRADEGHRITPKDFKDAGAGDHEWIGIAILACYSGGTIDGSTYAGETGTSEDNAVTFPGSAGMDEYPAAAERFRTR
jgi:RHS repeat-associated protein